MKRIGWILALLGLLLLWPACGEDESTTPTNTGVLQMVMTTTSSAGFVYRLRNGTFNVTGPTNVTLSTETDLDAGAIAANLAPGSYSVNLESGWYLERQTSGGYETVLADLVSANPVPFTMQAAQITNVTYQFKVTGVTDGGTGLLDIGIEVDDSDSGSDAAPDGATDGGTGLVFYCPFDSAADVTNPVVGTGGSLLGGSFVPGKKGNAFTSSGSDEVTFPGSIVPAHHGTLEFWAKLNGYANSEVIQWGNRPYFVWGPSLGLNGNDGAGTGNAGGGLVSGYGARASTHCYTTSVTYGTVLGDATAWHHYALAWDENGVPGSAYHIQMFLDGNPVGSAVICGVSADLASFPQATGNVQIIDNPNSHPGKSVTIDELKYWNYAKTSFSDSLQ